MQDVQSVSVSEMDEFLLSGTAAREDGANTRNADTRDKTSLEETSASAESSTSTPGSATEGQVSSRRYVSDILSSLMDDSGRSDAELINISPYLLFRFIRVEATATSSADATELSSSETEVTPAPPHDQGADIEGDRVTTPDETQPKEAPPDPEPSTSARGPGEEAVVAAAEYVVDLCAHESHTNLAPVHLLCLHRSRTSHRALNRRFAFNFLRLTLVLPSQG